MAKNLKRNDLSFRNWHEEFDRFWPENSKVSKIATLIGSFSPKHIIFELKTYRGVILHNTEEWFKVWRKTDLPFEKWHEEFGKFSPEHSKVSKLGLWWVSNLQRSYVSWKWRIMQNLKRNGLVVSKLTWGIWRILTRAFGSLKSLHFNGLLLSKVENTWV